MPRDPIVRRIIDVDYSDRDDTGRVIATQSQYLPFYVGDYVWARQGCAMKKGFVEQTDDQWLFIAVDWDSRTT
jgi:hypothetical protein